MRNFFPLIVITFVIGIWAADHYINKTNAEILQVPTTSITTSQSNQVIPTATPTIGIPQPTIHHHIIRRRRGDDGFEGE